MLSTAKEEAKSFKHCIVNSALIFMTPPGGAIFLLEDYL
jgi:hypothetical protein